jgi:ABC-type transporter Mla subunit MlaD
MLASMKDASAIMRQHLDDADKMLSELKTFVDSREAALNDAIKTIRAYKGTLDEATWEAFHAKHTGREEYQTFADLQEEFNGRYPNKIAQLEELMDRVQGNDDDGSIQDVSDPK